MSNVRPLRMEHLTPEVLLNQMMERCKDFKDIVIVTKDKHGEVEVYSSANLEFLLQAYFHVQTIAGDIAMGGPILEG